MVKRIIRSGISMDTKNFSVNSVDELLLKCSRAKIENSARNQIENLLVDNRLDWSEVLKKAKEQWIAPSLYYNFQQWRLAKLMPPKIEQDFKKIYLTNAARNATIFYHLSRLLKHFQENHIPVVVLKGAALAAAAYPLPSLRIMGDVDLLFKKADVALVDSSLLDLGYIPQAQDKWQEEKIHHIYLSPNNLFGLEVHWALSSPNIPAIIDVIKMWQRAGPLQVEDAEALTLSPEDLIQHLCIHALPHHNFYLSIQLRNVYDLWAIIDKYGSDKVDWDYLVESCRPYRTGIFVYLALRKLDESGEFPFLKEILKKFEPTVSEYKLSYLLENESFLNLDNLTDPIVEAVFELLREKGIIPRIKYLIKRAFPPWAILVQYYNLYNLSPSSKWIYLYYFLRPFILFGKHRRRLNLSSLQSLSRIGKLKAEITKN